MKKLTLRKKIIYGNELLYPNCEDSKVFAKMVGRKTLTEQDIKLIKLLGYEILCGEVEQL